MRNNGRHCHVLGARHGGDRADKEEERYPKSAVISSGVRGALSRPPNISDFIKNVSRGSLELRRWGNTVQHSPQLRQECLLHRR